MSKREFEPVEESAYVSYFKKYTYLLSITVIALSFYYRFLDFGQNHTHAFHGRISFVVLVFLSLIHCLFSICVVARQNFPVLHPIVYFYLQTTVYLQFYSNIRGYLRGDLWRCLITYPSSVFSAMILFEFVLIYTLGYILPKIFTVKRITMLLLPLMLFGLFLSLNGNVEVVNISMGNKWNKTLKVVQLSDIHLGPMMGVERLTKIAQKVAAEDPDLILITGDMYTLESHNEVDALSQGLAPLKKFEGKMFACFGNHDHEVQHTASQLKKVGARVLMNEKVQFETKYGKITIVGFDWVPEWNQAAMQDHLHLFDEDDSEYRLVLLHNPKYFTHVPQDSQKTNLVFSGHHHGGQIGFGSDFTILKLVSFPDANIWCKSQNGKLIRESRACVGTDRMYVHRGTGFYGIPLRVGVPSEESVFNIHL